MRPAAVPTAPWPTQAQNWAPTKVKSSAHFIASCSANVIFWLKTLLPLKFDHSSFLLASFPLLHFDRVVRLSFDSYGFYSVRVTRPEKNLNVRCCQSIGESLGCRGAVAPTLLCTEDRSIMTVENRERYEIPAAERSEHLFATVLASRRVVAIRWALFGSKPFTVKLTVGACFTCFNRYHSHFGLWGWWFKNYSSKS